MSTLTSATAPHHAPNTQIKLINFKKSHGAKGLGQTQTRREEAETEQAVWAGEELRGQGHLPPSQVTCVHSAGPT